MPSSDPGTLVEAFQLQARVCAKAAAPISAAILSGCAEEVAAGGAIIDVIAGWGGEPLEQAVPLRVLGALHRLALEGRAPELARWLPSTGGESAPDQAWAAAHELLKSQRSFITGYLARPPQTNEAGRSAMLLGGFLTAAKTMGLPMRLLELGASGGLNLLWDRYRTVTPAFSWGPSGDTLELNAQWEGPTPPLDAAIKIVDRAGCDRDPVDIRDADDCRLLESYVWADQPHRLARLRRAIEVARTAPFTLEQADADTWLEKRLSVLPRGQATVVFHSVFWSYLDGDTQSRLREIIEGAGMRATAQSPLAWLAMELPDMKNFPELTLTLWPGRRRHALATVHFHGDWVKWRGASLPG